MRGQLTVGADRSSEVELLLSCARTRVDSAHSARVEKLTRDVTDWANILRLADRHGLSALLHLQVTAARADAVPPHVLHDLSAHVRRIAVQNLAATRQLLELLELFDRERIPVRVLKGPALAVAAYGNVSLRPFRDLDLLVMKADVRRSTTLMLAHGYTAAKSTALRPSSALFDSSYHESFQRIGGVVPVEVHWGVARKSFGLRASADWLWAGGQVVSVGGRQVETLSSEATLLYLCVHGTKHLWPRLGWVCDVAELIARDADIDWSSVLRLARELGSSRMLRLGAGLARELLQVELPVVIQRQVEDDEISRRLVEQMATRLWSADPRDEVDSVAVHRFQLRVRERVRDKVRYCVRTAVTPNAEDVRALPLPPRLAAMYYLVRPVRLAGSFGRRLL